jgi:D-alanine-D-alanine ligase
MEVGERKSGRAGYRHCIQWNKEAVDTGILLRPIRRWSIVVLLAHKAAIIRQATRYNPRMRKSPKQFSRCDVALLVDIETGARGASGKFVVDRGSVEELLYRCLRTLYQHVVIVPFDPAVTPTLNELRALKPRVVFNITEWVDGDRRLDAAITGLLELLGLPYTGSGADALQICRDKSLSKQIVTKYGVNVAQELVIAPGERVRAPDFGFPLLVKPQYGDGSDSIGKTSLVRNLTQLRSRVRAIHRKQKQPALCEAFIPGNDIYVALLGNEPRVMRPIQVVIGRQHASAPLFATYNVKNNGAYRKRWRVHWIEPRLPAPVMREIRRASRAAFHALKLNGYARLDYRLTPDNQLVFLEANANPDLDPHSFGNNRCFAGVRYRDAIRIIVKTARRRARVG